MGLFDYVSVDDPRFACSEGHALSGTEFQTKDLGCTMGDASIAGGRLSLRGGGWGHDPTRPITAKVSVYTFCRQCPAFVQAGTGNLVATWVEFDVDVAEDAVRDVRRVSKPTADFLAEVPTLRYMAGARGPMPYAEAEVFHRGAAAERIRRERR